MLIGIYTITNIRNNKVYVGRAADIQSRIRTHRRMLRNNNHYNSYLQAAYNIEPENFKFEVLEVYPKELIIDMEQFWMNMTQAWDKNFGYNIDPSAYTNTSGSFSQETKDKIRAYHIGRKQSIETIKKRVESLKKLPKRNYHSCKGIEVTLKTLDSELVYSSIRNFIRSHKYTYRYLKDQQRDGTEVFLPELKAILKVGKNQRKLKNQNPNNVKTL